MKMITNLIVTGILIFLAGCTDKEPATTKPGMEYHFTRKDDGQEKAFPTYRISQGNNPTDNDFQQEAQVAATLDHLHPIAIPDKHAKSDALERQNAWIAYKKFLVEHQSDTVLIRHFRDKYANSLLHQYDLLHQSKHEQLQFLVEELIAAKTGRFATILQGLTALKQTTDPEVFSKLVAETQKQVQVSLELHQIARQRLPQMLENLKKGTLEPKGTLKKDFTVALIAEDDFQESIQMLEDYRKQLARL
ncbi:hypothetical protein [Dyadobacter sandarakinus]|uniref:Lipoprotein n=1 Tax=Dyadobacter sandarakinus TaxID=2747268 RepID=A0ABX7I656_9BACT|nr:hypothetical protein [Dyadobacter sandarakinus]QRR01584.1 hypothetical protein HWI92_12045 [Dyadobacter sandarakinus]